MRARRERPCMTSAEMGEGVKQYPKILDNCTELRYKVGPRLRELAPAARGDQEVRSRNLGPAL